MACPRFIHINFGHTKLGQIQYIKIQSLTLFSMYNQEIIELTNKHDKSRPVGFNGQISLSFCLLMQTSKNLINCISSTAWFYFTLGSKAALILPYFNLHPPPLASTHTHTHPHPGRHRWYSDHALLVLTLPVCKSRRCAESCLLSHSASQMFPNVLTFDLRSMCAGMDRARGGGHCSRTIYWLPHLKWWR